MVDDGAAVLLGLVYCGLTYGGAGATGAFPADIDRSALLIGMTCCAARVVFGSCAEIGVQQTVRNLEDFFLWLRDVWALARVKLNLCMVTV